MHYRLYPVGSGRKEVPMIASIATAAIIWLTLYFTV
jgi:hypothetical protein